MYILRFYVAKIILLCLIDKWLVKKIAQKVFFDTVYENQHPVILYLLLLHPYYSIFVHLDIKSCGKLTIFSLNSQENTLFLCHIFKL